MLHWIEIIRFRIHHVIDMCDWAPIIFSYHLTIIQVTSVGNKLQYYY